MKVLFDTNILTRLAQKSHPHREVARAAVDQLRRKRVRGRYGGVAATRTARIGDAGVHGYVYITYKDNFPKKFTAVLESLSDSEFYIAGAVRAKLEFCKKLLVKTDAQNQQTDLLHGQAQILDATRGNADLNYDGDTDMKDFAVFQQKFGTPGHPQP